MDGLDLAHEQLAIATSSIIMTKGFFFASSAFNTPIKAIQWVRIVAHHPRGRVIA